jgi:hypothetical protein
MVRAFASGPRVTWQTYAAALANQSQWDPSDVVSRDALAKVRAGAEDWAVGYQAIRQVREGWKALPPDVRDLAVAQLDKVADRAAAGFDTFDGLPIVEWIAQAVEVIFKIVVAFQSVGTENQNESNFSRSDAVRKTLEPLLAGGAAPVYSVLPVFEYAEFVKVRIGGDYQRRPALTRNGGDRDAIFTGRRTPGNTGDCDKEMRRSQSESKGPFAAKCGHKLGLSALFFPWYSAAYSPAPIPRYRWKDDGHGINQTSFDNNSVLAAEQIRLLTEPAHNLRCSLSAVTTTAARVRAWWNGAGPMRPVRWKGGDLVAWDPPAQWWTDRGMPVGHKPQIDARRDSKHVPTKAARAFWYLSGGVIRAYPNQPNSDPDLWGKALPAGKPAELACSATMLSGVESVASAFAARRLATIRSPNLSRAMLADIPLAQIDGPARSVLAYAAKQPGIIAYPSTIVRRVQQAKPSGTSKPADKGAGMVAAAAAAWFFLR